MTGANSLSGIAKGAGIIAGMLILLSVSLVFLLPAQGFASHPPNNKSLRIAVIKPTFTAAAYQSGGFYSYFRGICSAKCLTIHLVSGHEDHNSRYHNRSPEHAITNNALMNYAGSARSVEVLRTLGLQQGNPVHFITDEQLTEHPSILNTFDRVVILHNEYVSQAEFDAITHHPHVLYLYPNSLYALVSYNSLNQTVTLQKGHGLGGVNDAFGWGPSKSTNDEYDRGCANLHFSKVENGDIINCYPEVVINQDKQLLNEIEARLFVS